jgi:hypothetical protein
MYSISRFIKKDKALAPFFLLEKSKLPINDNTKKNIAIFNSFILELYIQKIKKQPIKRKKMSEQKITCAICAWREHCKKKYSIIDPSKCLDFSRDVTIKEKKEENEN